jgi:hypothetical protein
MRSNGFPSGHTDLHSRHPGLLENFPKRILVAEVLSASFGLEMEEDEASEDVERLFEVSEATRVIGEESRGIVLAFPDGFAEEHERPGESEIGGRLPSFQTFRYASHARWAIAQSSKQCRGDSSDPASQILHWGGSPMTYNHVPTGRPLLRVSQMRVPTFLGRALCQILAMTWAGVEFWKLSPWTKARRPV